MNDDAKHRYWFPAKKYGWGWGLPSRWEGWVSLAAFVALMVANSIVFEPDSHPVEFFLGVGLLCAAITGVCYLKGEPPAWRWGKS